MPHTKWLLSAALLGAFSGCAVTGNRPEDLLESKYQSPAMRIEESAAAVNARLQKELASCYGGGGSSMQMINGVAFQSGGARFQVEGHQQGDTTTWLILGTMIGRYMMSVEVSSVADNASVVKTYVDNRFWQDASTYATDVAAGRPTKCPLH